MFNPAALRLPVDLLEQVEAIAHTCERTRSWMIVRALKLFLSGEGSEILLIRRGREQLAAGQSHDPDDVMRELEADQD